MKIFIGAESEQTYVQTDDGMFMEYVDYVGEGGFSGEADSWGEELIALERHPTILLAADVVAMAENGFDGGMFDLLYIEIEKTVRRLVNEKRLG